ncbi:hypothetical protein [Sphingomonas sp. RS2018]
MRTIPGYRDGSTFGGGRGKAALAVVVTAVAAGALVMAVGQSDDNGSEGIVRVEASMPVLPVNAAAAAPEPVEARMLYELHGTSPGGARPTALLAPHGATPRSFVAGERVGPGVVLESVAPGHVLLREGAALVRIDLPPRLGGSGEAVAPADRGLKPEPQPPTGELSGAQMASIRAQRGDPPPTLPGDEPSTNQQ